MKNPPENYTKQKAIGFSIACGGLLLFFANPEYKGTEVILVPVVISLFAGVVTTTASFFESLWLAEQELQREKPMWEWLLLLCTLLINCIDLIIIFSSIDLLSHPRSF